MVYWLNAAAASSARLYWHSLAPSIETFDEVPAPSAYSHFPADNVALSERWARTRYTDLRYYGTPQRGGHFAAYENPAEFVTEVRAGLRALQEECVRAVLGAGSPPAAIAQSIRTHHRSPGGYLTDGEAARRLGAADATGDVRRSLRGVSLSVRCLRRTAAG